MVSTVHLVMSVLYLGTIVLMLAEGVVTAIRMRGTPQEVLQLRIFGFQEGVNRALIVFTMGVILGILAVLPMTLEASVPDLWYYATSVPATALAWYAILKLGAVFRVHAVDRRKRAGESLP